MNYLKIALFVVVSCTFFAALWLAALRGHIGLALLIVACLPALAVTFTAFKALVTRKKVLPEKPQRKLYCRLVSFLTGFSAISWAGGLFWLVAGAGIYGSPISTDAFQIDPRTGYTDYWSYWMVFVIAGGSLALFPFMLIERYASGAGAVAMVVSGTLVAEAGIRASRMFWGFSDADALLVIAFITVPMFFFALVLLLLGDSHLGARRTIGGLMTVCFRSIGIAVRYQVVKQFWNLNCPSNFD